MPITISLIASLLVPLILTQAGPGLRGSPPPPPPVERVTPRPGYAWIEGNYEWHDGRYAWTGGHWERERPGRRWHGGRWDWRGDRYVWVRGEWVAAPRTRRRRAWWSRHRLRRRLRRRKPRRSPPQRAGYVWIPPAHEWRDGHYVWIEGHWERNGAGYHWESGRTGLVMASPAPRRMAQRRPCGQRGRLVVCRPISIRRRRGRRRRALVPGILDRLQAGMPKGATPMETHSRCSPVRRRLACGSAQVAGCGSSTSWNSTFGGSKNGGLSTDVRLR